MKPIVTITVGFFSLRFPWDRTVVNSSRIFSKTSKQSSASRIGTVPRILLSKLQSLPTSERHLSILRGPLPAKHSRHLPYGHTRNLNSPVDAGTEITSITSVTQPKYHHQSCITTSHKKDSVQMQIHIRHRNRRPCCANVQHDLDDRMGCLPPTHPMDCRFRSSCTIQKVTWCI